MACAAGVSAAHIDALARDKIAAQGLCSFFPHHTGHHVGFRYHDPGFLIAPGVNAKLEPGMVITIEPGVYVPERGGGARIEDNVLVTESGHEVLSQSGREPAAMISIDLSGKTILITGALGAIAEHMVQKLAPAVRTLVLTDIKRRSKPSNARGMADSGFLLFLFSGRYHRFEPGGSTW